MPFPDSPFAAFFATVKQMVSLPSSYPLDVRLRDIQRAHFGCKIVAELMQGKCRMPGFSSVLSRNTVMELGYSL